MISVGIRLRTNYKGIKEWQVTLGGRKVLFRSQSEQEAVAYFNFITGQIVGQPANRSLPDEAGT